MSTRPAPHTYVAPEAGTHDSRFGFCALPRCGYIKAALIHQDKVCKHCDQRIYLRGDLRWDLIFRDQLVTTTCYGTTEEFGTEDGHQPV